MTVYLLIYLEIPTVVLLVIQNNVTLWTDFAGGVKPYGHSAA